MTPVISVKDLTKSFNGKVAVDCLTLNVNRGDIFGFLGPNGSGKTTTIRMISGLLTPDAGTGICLGCDITRETQKIKEKIGYMTQKFSLYDDLTIEENLDFSARLYQIQNRAEKIETVLTDLKLHERRKQLTGTLSGGWKQRLALSCTLLHEPELLLLDEPTAGVDPKARHEFWDEIQKLSQKGITTLVSTHYMDEAARCNQLAFIAYSKLLVSGTVSEIREKTGFQTDNLEEIFVRLLK